MESHYFRIGEILHQSGEDRGVIEALDRSAALGICERWRMIGLVLLIATTGLVVLSIMKALLFFVS